MNRIPSAIGTHAVFGRGRLVIVLVATVVFTTLAGAAFGYWGTFGSGVGSARTGTLNAPNGVNVSSTAGSGSVSVSWSSPSGTPAAQGYYVKRTPSAGGASAFACGTSASTLNAGNSCTDSGVADGTYTYAVTAVYNSWTAASAPSSSVTVSNTIGTTTTLTSSSNPSVVGQQVTYTATVAATSGSATPTGSVTFKDETNTALCGGAQTLTAGSALCSVTYTAPGSHSITATYGGTTGFNGSATSSALVQSINKADTTTTVTSSGNPSVAGQPVTFTATVSAKAPGAGTPTGTVTFTDGGTSLTCAGSSQTLNASGTATCQVSFASAGDHAISAVYGGDANFAGSPSGAITQTMNPPAASTTSSLQSSQNPAKSGSSVTYNATVKDTRSSAVTTGTVSFSDNGTVISGCSAKALDATGHAACTPSVYTDKGSHNIVATYSGGTGYAGSTSAPLVQRIVDSQVVGLSFANVTVDNVAVTPTCVGSIGTTYTCTVSGGNNAVLAANSTFVSSIGALVSYAADDQTVNAAVAGKSSGNTSLTMPGNGTTSTTKATATKTGSNSATITITFSDGVSSFTAQLKII